MERRLPTALGVIPRDELAKFLRERGPKNEYANTIAGLLEKGKKVDPSFAVALVEGAFGVKLKGMGSAVLGEEGGDVDLHGRVPEELSAVVRSVLYHLTRRTVELMRGNAPDDPVAGKIFRLAEKTKVLRGDPHDEIFWRFHGSSVRRDLDHTGKVLERISRDEELRNIYVETIARGLLDLIRATPWPEDRAALLKAFRGEHSKYLVKRFPDHGKTVEFMRQVIDRALELYEKEMGRKSSNHTNF